MPTNKKIIAEQVLRVVNGGATTDDQKVSLQEVVNLVDYERDALIKKAIMEGSMLGEHEIPNEFLHMDKLNLTPLSSFPGNNPRFQASFNRSPIYLPNDGSIFQVCPVEQEDFTPDIVDEKHGSVTIEAVDTRYVYIEDVCYENDAIESNVSINFSILRTTDIVGNKIKFSFKHGMAKAEKNYSFTFTYKGGGKNMLTNQIDPLILLQSLDSNSDFQDFLVDNELYFTYNENNANKLGTDFYLKSSGQGQVWGDAGSTPFSFTSLLTNKEVVKWGNDGLIINSSHTATNGVGDTPYNNFVPSVSFGIKIDYSKNRRLEVLGTDTLGVKEKGSSVLNTIIELKPEDLKQDEDGGYSTITGWDLARMWFNKYHAILQTYGIMVSLVEEEISDARGSYLDLVKIKITEHTGHGGFDKVEFQNFSGTEGTVEHEMREDMDETMKKNVASLNYQPTDCYFRMPHPGVYSRLYDDAILLSGKKYWYREDNKICIYNSDYLYSTEVESRKIYVWYIADSSSYGMDDNLPMPGEYVVEIIQNLIQTFTQMRQAAEDVVNDNIDVS